MNASTSGYSSNPAESTGDEDNNNSHLPNSMNWKSDVPKSMTPRYDAVAAQLKCNTGAGGGGSSSQFAGVIVVGGRSGESDALDTVELFEWRLRRWWKMPPLTTPRCGCMVATINDNIFVAGGYQGDRHLDSAEIFSFGKDGQQWEPVVNMTTSRWYGAAVALSRHNLILAIGGRDDSWNELATMDAYNIEKHAWMPLENMATPRFGCGAVAISHSKVLVVGGFDGKEWTTSSELYDFESDTWSSTKVSPMPHRVRFCVASTVVQEGKYVFVFGQVDEGDYDSLQGGLMQCYNVNENKWAVLHNVNDLSGSAIASIGQYMFAVGGLSIAPPSGTMDNETDEYGSLISQDAFSWKLADMDFARLWSDEPLPPPQHRQPRARHVPPQRQQQPPPPPPQQQPVHQGNGGYMETSIVAVAVDHSMDVNVHHQQNMAHRSLNQHHRAASNMSAADSSVSGSNMQQQYPMQPPASPITTTPSMFSGAMSGAPGAAPGYAAPAPNHVASTALTIYNSNMSVASGLSDVPRRLVEAESMMDNYGVPVVYTGQVSERSGKPDGKGRMTWTTTGDIYEGSFRHGARDGNGRMTYKNGDTFQGIYRDDQREGHGVYHYLKENRTYDGLYADDEQEDMNGTMTWKNGTIYIGQFKGSKRTGKGMVRFPNQVKYTGDFVNGKYHGFGVCKFGDGSVYEGQWRKGKAHGQGKLVNAQGQVVHDGSWVNDGPMFE